eukprot:scaffold9593_cov22-Tisochrysis_lutea.AAC.1
MGLEAYKGAGCATWSVSMGAVASTLQGNFWDKATRTSDFGLLLGGTQEPTQVVAVRQQIPCKK